MKPGMQIVRVGGVDVKAEPRDFVVQRLMEAKFPLKIDFCFSKDLILAQGACDCAFWKSVQTGVLKDAEEKKRKQPTNQQTVDPKSSQLIDTKDRSAQSETKRETKTKDSSTTPEQMVVLDCQGLKLYAEPDSKSRVNGRYGLGACVLARMADDPDYVRVNQPYAGWVKARRDGRKLIASSKEMRTLESIMEASLPHLQRTRLGDKDRVVWADVGSVVSHYDSISKHILTAMAKYTNIDSSTIELITDYTREGTFRTPADEFERKICTTCPPLPLHPNL